MHAAVHARCPQDTTVYWSTVWFTALAYPMAFWHGDAVTGELTALDADELFVRAVLEGGIKLENRKYKWSKKVGNNVQYGLTEDAQRSLCACHSLGRCLLNNATPLPFHQLCNDRFGFLLM